MSKYEPKWTEVNKTPCPKGSFDCPHCGTRLPAEFKHAKLSHTYLDSAVMRTFGGHLRGGVLDNANLKLFSCPSCNHPTFHVEIVRKVGRAKKTIIDGYLYPIHNEIMGILGDVPVNYRELFEEAANTLQTSARACVALSRVLLENILINEGYPKREKNKKLKKDGRIDLYNRVLDFTEDLDIPLRLRSRVDIVRTEANIFLHESDVPAGFIGEEGKKEAVGCLAIIKDILNYFYIEKAECDAEEEAVKSKIREAGGNLVEPEEGKDSEEESK